MGVSLKPGVNNELCETNLLSEENATEYSRHIVKGSIAYSIVINGLYDMTLIIKKATFMDSVDLTTQN